MFGFKKKEKKPLIIRAKDVMEIIKSDYEDGEAFTLIEFVYQGRNYILGSCFLSPYVEECKENLSFVFQEAIYPSFQEFASHVCLGETPMIESSEPIEVIRAGIIGNDTVLASPWGETRLAKKALRT